MSGDTPTEQFFPASGPHEVGDVIARVLAVVAIFLVVGLHISDHLAKVDDVDRDRAACVRVERDLKIERDAWFALAQATGLDSVNAQVRRIESIIRRDCEKRYPEPSIIG